MRDSLVIVGDNLFGPSLSVSDCLSRSQELGIDAVVAAPARGRDYSLPAANDRLAASTEHLDSVRRLARVDPNQGDQAAAELDRAAKMLGCAGLFLNPDEEVFRIQDALPLVRQAAELGLPSVVVAGVPLRSEPLQILELATAAPDATLVLTSGGQINIAGLGMVDAWMALRASDKIRVLSNGEYRQDYLTAIVDELGPERLLFASSAPVYDQAFEVARIRNVDYTDDQRALIEDGNSRQLFG